jgi:hypothetical protein
MGMHLGKFVHTQTGKLIMSILLGFGLASLFRKVCKHNNCTAFYAPPLEDFVDKIYKWSDGEKCVSYKPNATKCDTSKKIVFFNNDKENSVSL